MRITPSKVNRAIHNSGIDCRIVRGKGYYFFTNENVPSIYAWSLVSYTLDDIVEHVRKHCTKA